MTRYLQNMNRYINIFKYSLRNIYIKKIKKFTYKPNNTNTVKLLNDFLDNIDSTTIVVFAGLKQLKYYGGIENPAEVLYELLCNKFENIIVPTFTRSVIKTKEFDILNTPSESGSFSNYFLGKADFRTSSPFKSFAIKGPIRDKIKKLQFFDDFGENGIFDFMHKKYIPSINIGTHDIRPNCIHLTEYLTKVPYLISNNIRVKITNLERMEIGKEFILHRYNTDYKFNRDKIEKELLENKLILSEIINGINVRFIPEEGYFQFFIEKLEKDPYYLVN